MTRLLWAFGGALAAVSLPLALSSTTAWLLVPTHLVFAAVATVGALAEAWAHRVDRTRLWGFAYLVGSAAMLGALEVGPILRREPDWSWALPFVGMLLWGWVPPVVAGLAAWWESGRQRRRTR